MLVNGIEHSGNDALLLSLNEIDNLLIIKYFVMIFATIRTKFHKNNFDLSLTIVR